MEKIANNLIYTPLVLAFLLFMLTGNLFLKSFNLKSKGTKVQGVVVAIDNENSALYSSIVEFTTKAGEKITFTGGEANNPATYGKGETVDVLYYEDNPESAKINDWESLYLTTTFAGIWTLILAVMGIVVIKVANPSFLKFDGNETERKAMKQKKLSLFPEEKKYPIEIVLPLSIGIICLVLAYLSYVNVKKDISNSIKVEAIVLEYSPHPFIGFKTLDGTEIKYRSPVSTNPPMYQKGEIIEVYYDKDFPDKVRIRNFWNLWFLTSFLEGFGGIWFLIGVFFWKQRRKIKY